MEWRPQPFGQFGARLGDLGQEEPGRNAQGTSKLFRIERDLRRVRSVKSRGIVRYRRRIGIGVRKSAGRRDDAEKRDFFVHKIIRDVFE